MTIDIMSEIFQELGPVYAWWSCILILQMMTLTWFTGQIRVKHKVIHSEEDRMWMEEPNIILCTSGGGHTDVDRIRSVHFHDLKTIMSFLLLIPLWFTTSPSYTLANTIIRLYSISKILDSIISMNLINLPAFISLAIRDVCYGILLYMSSYICWYYLLH